MGRGNCTAWGVSNPWGPCFLGSRVRCCALLVKLGGVYGRVVLMLFCPDLRKTLLGHIHIYWNINIVYKSTGNKKYILI